MTNCISILQPIVVVVTNVDGTRTRYEDYYYCGNGMLAYFNPQNDTDHSYVCFGKFNPDNNRPVYYIPYNYINKARTAETNRLTLTHDANWSDFDSRKVVDGNTFETSPIAREGYTWFENLRKEAERYLKIYNTKN